MLKILMSQDFYVSVSFIVYALLFTIFEKRAENRIEKYLKSYNGRWVLLNFLGNFSNDNDDNENDKKQ